MYETVVELSHRIDTSWFLRRGPHLEMAGETAISSRRLMWGEESFEFHRPDRVSDSQTAPHPEREASVVIVDLGLTSLNGLPEAILCGFVHQSR